MNDFLTDIAGTLNKVLSEAVLIPWTPRHQQSTGASLPSASSDSEEVPW